MLGWRILQMHAKLQNPDIYVFTLHTQTDVGMGKIAEGCPQLKVLDLSECEKVTDNGIIKISECCSELERLYLYHLFNVSDNVQKNLKKRQEEISVHTASAICVFN